MIDRLALNASGLESRESSHTGGVMNSSQELIALARTGDHEAFRLLFERYAAPVMLFTYNLVGRRDVAEELTQETFVRAYRNLKKLRDEARFSTWLFGIGRNVAREWLRSSEPLNRRGSIDAESVPEPQHPAGISPADQLQEKELNAAIEIALQSLDDERRMVFALKVFHQYSYQEIVDITGFSLGKVKTELHRARVEMRRRLRTFRETK